MFGHDQVIPKFGRKLVGQKSPTSATRLQDSWHNRNEAYYSKIIDPYYNWRNSIFCHWLFLDKNK